MTRVRSVKSCPISFAHMASKPKLVKPDRSIFKDLNIAPKGANS